MDYVAVGCLGIDNIINTVGIKKLNVFGGNAAFGTAGISIWHDGEVGVVSRKKERTFRRNGSGCWKSGELTRQGSKMYRCVI